MYYQKLKRLVLAILFIALSLKLFIACEDDPVTPQEDHFEAIGMVFYTSGIEVARILRGETSDTLFALKDTLSDHFEVMYFDKEENIVDPPSEEHASLSWQIEDQTIVNVWQHEGEEGAFEFHLNGLNIGETEIEFFIMHSDHSDYRSGKIPVKVK